MKSVHASEKLTTETSAITMGHITAESSNIGGTFMPWEMDARIFRQLAQLPKIVREPTYTLTESNIPLARGLPSIRTGLPPMYGDIFSSSDASFGL